MSTTLKIEDYLARGEAKPVLAKQRRIDGYECCICPEFSGKGKRMGLARALRHFRTNEHRRKAARRKAPLRPSASLNQPQNDVAIDCGFARSQGLDDVTIGDSFSDSEEERSRQRNQNNSPAEAAHDEIPEPLTDGHDETSSETHLTEALNEDLTEDRHFRLQDDEHSGADDEEARAYNLIDRGLATDPDMKHLETLRKSTSPLLRPIWRGFQILLARSIRDSSRGARLDPSSERKIDKKTLKHFFRPYAKAVIALPRLCQFYKAAQGAVEELVREEGLLDAQLERTSKVYRRTATDALTHAMADAMKDYHFQLKKISDHIAQHRDPIYLMANYVDNSLVFSDEHIVYWCLGVHFFRLFKAEDHDSKDRFFKAYENFLGDVADEIMKERREAGSHAFDWRRYL